LKKIIISSFIFLLLPFQQAFAHETSNKTFDFVYVMEIFLFVLFLVSMISLVLSFIVKSRRKLFLSLFSILLCLSILLSIIWVIYGSKAENEKIEELNTSTSIDVLTLKDEGRKHIDEEVMPEYVNHPPTSGPHFTSVTDYGFYEKDIDIRILIHNMEHGDVIIYYHPQLADSDIKKLKHLSHFTKSDGINGSGVIVLPKNDMDEEIIATSWNKKMTLETFHYDKVAQFIYNHIRKGPEDVPMLRIKK